MRCARIGGTRSRWSPRRGRRPRWRRRARGGGRASRSRSVSRSGGRTMPLYMTQFAYTPEAWAALAKNPEDRTEALRGLAKKMGGKVVNLYYSFGEYDGVAIFEAPDDVSAAAVAVAASGAGHVKGTKTTRLL